MVQQMGLFVNGPQESHESGAGECRPRLPTVAIRPSHVHLLKGAGQCAETFFPFCSGRSETESAGPGARVYASMFTHSLTDFRVESGGSQPEVTKRYYCDDYSNA